VAGRALMRGSRLRSFAHVAGENCWRVRQTRAVRFDLDVTVTSVRIARV
jgi:hypothetical protein